MEDYFRGESSGPESEASCFEGLYCWQVLRRFAGQYFPIFAIRSWLDEHLSIRLSILFAYLFGKSELALQLLKWLGATGNVIKAALEPVNAYIGSVACRHI